MVGNVAVMPDYRQEEGNEAGEDNESALQLWRSRLGFRDQGQRRCLSRNEL